MDELRNTQDAGELVQYIVIKLGDEQYGIDIKYIDNIVRMQQITRVPKVEHFLKGVINIATVMSRRLKMGIKEDEITSKSRIIILRLESGDLIGIIVDQVNQVLTLSTSDVEKVRYDDKNQKAGNSFISGVGKYEGGLVSILDLSTLELDTKDKKDKKD